MIIDKPCLFDPICDVEAVSQTGAIDLYAAFATHTIPTTLDDSEVAYNGIENPSSILGKPTDVFDATRKMSYINSVGKKETTGESVVTDA